MKLMFRVIAITLFLTFASLAAANSPRFGSLNADDGLPGYTVWDVAQDDVGYLWIATVAGLARFDGHSIEQFTASENGHLLEGEITRELHIDGGNSLWIGTDSGGLFRRLEDGSFQSFRHDPLNVNSLSSNRVMAIADSNSGELWVGTNNGLNRLNIETGKFDRFLFDPNEKNRSPNSGIRSLLMSTSGDLWIGTYAGLSLYDPVQESFKTIQLDDKDLKILTLYEGSDGAVWVGTYDGLYRYYPRTQTVSQPIDELADKEILSIEMNPHGTWVGTLFDGLFKLSEDNVLTNYSYSRNENSLADNVITSLFTDRGGVMWIGTFQNGLSNLDLSSLAFGRHDDAKSSVSCMASRTVYGLLPEPEQILWIATDRGVVRYNRNTSECKLYAADRADAQALEHSVISILRASNDALWVGTSVGLNLLNISTGKVDRLEGLTPDTAINILIKKNNDTLLLGTGQGLYQYNIPNRSSKKVETTDKELISSDFTDHTLDAKGTYWFATNQGVAKLDADGKLKLLRHQGASAIPHPVNAIHVSARGEIWAGVANLGLWVLNSEGKVLQKFDADDNFPTDMFYGGILPDQRNNMWVSSQSGITKINANREVERTYTTADGLQGKLFNSRSAFASSSGELFFGGRNGFNAFFPEEIVDNQTPPSIVFKELRLNNQIIRPGEHFDNFKMEAPIDQNDVLKLKHHHKMISLEFIALDYAAANRNKYTYKLEGFDTDWISPDQGQRQATYTNLNAGSYEFKVRAANKDGVWNNQGRALTIQIAPAPWATWWARTAYVLFILGGILTFTQIRIGAQRRRAAELELEVDARTREVEQQKLTIEKMLARKVSLFENVSHEFRTPLTLLIGPLKQLRKKLDDKALGSDVDLALANANRLLMMVDQLLDLAELSKDSNLEKRPRALAPALHMLMASFSLAAKQNRVRLELHSVADATVNVSNDALEIIVGNLISNAIKYAGEEGHIVVAARAVLDQVEITVHNDGPGIDAELTGSIFDRFTRLPEHSSIPGTGLGLAVTKEVVEANGGTIQCTSKINEGVTFVVTLPSVEANPTAHPTQSVKVLALAEELTEQQAVSIDVSDEDTSDEKPYILVIDDNTEILSYIQSILKPEFNFLGAASGEEGIQIAKDKIPDLIISDVMMPGLDGFEVSNRLRSDDVTSHIPIILLTARGDRTSRLRGWQESADEFLQKPFDEEELCARINNLLNIRKLLRTQLGEQFASGEKLSTSKLCKRDEVFIDKLTQVVEDNFHNPNFVRSQFASIMAVSERQLQRKLKSIINCNPSEFLREFRLNRAKHLLSEGRPVGLVFEDCGFTSGSYFAKCFREKFGTSPKQHQSQVIPKGRNP